MATAQLEVVEAGQMPAGGAPGAAAGGDADAANLEKELKEFSGGLPYDQGRIIERTQDGFRQGVHGFYLAGLGLILIFQHEGAQTSAHILEQYFPGISRRSAESYMQFARAASQLPNFKQFCLERGGYSKGLTMLQSCTEEEIAGFEGTGELLGYTPDQIDKMSCLSLKKALRRAREHEAQSVKRAVEKSAAENAELRAKVEDLEAQVGAGETPAEKALKRILNANDRIFQGIRLLGEVEEALLTANKTVRQQLIGVCEHAITLLEGLSTDAAHAGAVEGADY